MTPDRKTRLDDETLATALAVLGDDTGGEPQIGHTGAEKAKPADAGDDDASPSPGARPERNAD
ncbi:hypothetical protein [Aureimonas pseudogalii]|uniref:Uncharacterized protein n=1 Tax=Aureimonas pseudogalii TaxID=1744844 RepID=A0A7W6H3Y6_9HYPH|nr:hypothetical protein [Aureimonas pseudogalii]MBB3996379.1 hypothetical protein [Aureimonas pseudogalii]